MIRVSPGMANRLWLLKSTRAWRAFRRAGRNPRKSQTRLLEGYLKRNASTEYGRKQGFAGLGSVAEFQDRVALVTYDDLVEEIGRIGEGRPGVLCSEPVLLLQPSSGSTAATKLIPFTASLKREFDRGVAVWITDLFRNRPDLMGGPAYWSVSPATGEDAPKGNGIRVGFEEDAAYLGGAARRLVQSVLAVPQEVGLVRDTEAHRYLTLLHLLACPDLRIISVWSPTYLSLLLEPLESWWAALLEDLAKGGFHPPGAKAGGTGGRNPAPDFPAPIPPNPSRARELRGVDPTDLRAIWPRLGLLSTWADGTSSRYAHRLSRSFPGVPLQPKGLIATEAFVSLPLWGVDGAVPAITSHFLEFIPEGAPEDRPRLVDELDKGARYEVVVTTGGGLYRYRMGDLVEVVGFKGKLPCLRFGGRADKVSDLFGEKLSDGFVARVFETLSRRHGLSPAFSLLAPDLDGDSPPRYTWFLHSPKVAGSPRIQGILKAELDTALSESFHYRTCRKLGQLAPAEVRLVDDQAPQRYLLEEQRRGRKLGEIKIPALESGEGWMGVLAEDGATR